MGQTFTDQDYAKALETCAAEPVHIPGLVQPFGCLIGLGADSQRITYASANCGSVIGIEVKDLLGKPVRDIFESEIIHALNNAASRGGFDTKSSPLGTFKLGEADFELRAFGSEQTRVLQFEPARDAGLGGSDALNTLAFLMGEIQGCTTQQALFDITTDLMRHISGYDRVLVYKFDPNHNGVIVSEARQRAMESFMGLRFPHWDIPAQARAIMAKLPLRFIEDVDQDPVPLHAANASLPPLDITFAECRGVSTVHMEYLRNMKVRSTMTLSVMVEGKLWGIISFHHRRPRVPASKVRDLLTAFLNIFSTKLGALIKQAQLDLVRRTDGMKDTVLQDIESEEALEGSISRIGEVVEDVLEADGIVFMIGSKTASHGRVPEQAVLEHILTQMQPQLGTPIVTDSLKASYPQFEDRFNGCAGMIASAISGHRGLMIFRREVAQRLSWAGNPEKDIEVVSGRTRLSPRGSFSTYLQDVNGFSEPWTSDDVYFAERIWVLVNSAESRSLKNTLARQQTLMINELNHRVRNILALVRSVSRQARRHNGSLDSYSTSLESRVQALAAAHDIASGSGVTGINIEKIVALEMKPYSEDGSINIQAVARSIRADIAPIFSLLIHELATNAAKYGALSVKDGAIDIDVVDVEKGISVTWRERGGPPVEPVKEHGFGTTLIEQAVPYEMGGTAKLSFETTGVVAEFLLPHDILDSHLGQMYDAMSFQDDAMGRKTVEPFKPEAFDGFVLLLEDNFVIAKDLSDQLGDAGLDDVAIYSTVSDALETIEAELPSFAILDVNLGDGTTSEPVARRLLQLGVPFVFLTGYGSRAELAPTLRTVPLLSKPVSSQTLLNAMMALI